MRWTKGKPASQAPFGVVVLAAFDPHPYDPVGRKTYYRTAVHRNLVSGPRFYGWPGEVVLDRQPDRFWTLPEE